jgi:AcrR family transcriptional regulator
LSVDLPDNRVVFSVTASKTDFQLQQANNRKGAARMALNAVTTGQGTRPRHPNAQRLLDVTIELLDTTPLEQISLATVLELSGVSNGSLYYHFDDFRDLVEQAAVERFTQGLNDSISAIAELLDCTDAADFRQRVEHIILVFHDQDRRPFRMARLDTLGALATHPRLAERIGRAQEAATHKQGEYYAEFQRRGWLRNDLDPMALSAFMTATFLGRIVDDITMNPVDPAEWNNVVLTAFRAILFPN